MYSYRTFDHVFALDRTCFEQRYHQGSRIAIFKHICRDLQTIWWEICQRWTWRQHQLISVTLPARCDVVLIERIYECGNKWSLSPSRRYSPIVLHTVEMELVIPLHNVWVPAHTSTSRCHPLVRISDSNDRKCMIYMFVPIVVAAKNTDFEFACVLAVAAVVVGGVEMP